MRGSFAAFVLVSVLASASGAESPEQQLLRNTCAGSGFCSGSPQAPPAPPSRRKLSFKEKHALQTLPETIDTLTAEIAALQDKLGDGALYAKDPRAFATATTRMAEAQAELSTAEEQWLELESLREELEG